MPTTGDALRAELSVLIATEPPGELREDLRRFDDTVGALIVSLSQLVSPEIRQMAMEAGETRNPYEVAEEQHAEADRLARKIIDHLHGTT
jgi:hypothetical protein